MPGSYRGLDHIIKQRINEAFPDRAATRILDVGAGKGKYRDLLSDYSQVDAIEAHEPYVAKYRLGERYNSVFVTDVRNVSHTLFGAYDLLILGDILEHFTVPDARDLLKQIARYPETAVLVVVPWNYRQDAVGGVEWERHIQPDLTHEVFNERYPGFTCLVRDDVVGAYARPASFWGEGEWDR